MPPATVTQDRCASDGAAERTLSRRPPTDGRDPERQRRAKTPNAATAKTTTTTARSTKTWARFTAASAPAWSASRAAITARSSTARRWPQATSSARNDIDDDCDGNTDESADADGDGFSLCDGDCCDKAGACGDQPAQVNPGAFEVLGNDIDDDCDASSSDEKPQSCEPAALQTPTSAK